MKIEVKTAFTILKVLFTHVVLTGEYFDYFHFNLVDLTKINVVERILASFLIVSDPSTLLSVSIPFLWFST